MENFYYLDLFAGGGGLSEGFVQAGFSPVAHIEMDKAACYTLKTRQAYYWLKKNNKINIYYDYLENKITRNQLYNYVPKKIINTVINEEISDNTINSLFKNIAKKIGKRKISLIIGGPPCQAYSIVGRARDEKSMEGDSRNYLYIQYAKFLKRFNPDFFVFENVLGLLSAKDSNGKKYFDAMINLFESLEYKIDYRILDASNFGVFQKRKRIIIIGSKKNPNFCFPNLEIDNFINIKVNDLFSDLPKLKAGEGTFNAKNCLPYNKEFLYEIGIKDRAFKKITYHFARKNNKKDLEIYKIAVKNWNSNNQRLNYNDLPQKLKTQKNTKSFLDRYKVIEGEWNFCHTIVAHLSKDGHYYIHPDINQNRSITPREAARIQSFPDNYYFETIRGTPAFSPVFKQIGNAVPVRLAKKIADKIMEIINE